MMKTNFQLNVDLELEIYFDFEPEERPRRSGHPDFWSEGTPAYPVIKSIWLTDPEGVEAEEIMAGRPLWNAIMTHARTLADAMTVAAQEEGQE